MKRPSFQFYPADWRSNTNLRRCSLAARGAWVDVMCVLHDSDEYGVVRWPLSEIASVAGVPPDLLAELVAKHVLKGDDAAAAEFTHTTRHAGKDGPTHVLIPASVGPCWFSSRMVVDEFRRNASGGETRFGSPDRQPSQRQGVRQGETPSGKPSQRHGHGAPSPSPSPSSATPTDEKATPSLAADKPPRARDVLLDALCQHAEATDPTAAQPRLWPKCAAALKQIRAASPDVTPAEIARRCRNYASQLPPGSMLTSTGLANHWGRCATGNNGQQHDALAESEAAKRRAAF